MWVAVGLFVLAAVTAVLVGLICAANRYDDE